MPCGRPAERQTLIGERVIPYVLHRSPRRRKSIALVIDGQQLRVLAPKRTPLKHVDDLLRRRADWIAERLAAPAPARLRDQLRLGGRLPLLGEDTPVERGEAPFHFDGQRFSLDPSRDNLPAVAERWLRAYARADFTERVNRWATVIGARPRRIQVRDQQTRWGSASSRGTLSFNWRLIFAQPEIVDYVVVHELCHLIEPNHSAAYWRLVETQLPDYQLRRQQLKDAADDLVW